MGNTGMDHCSVFPAVSEQELSSAAAVLVMWSSRCKGGEMLREISCPHARARELCGAGREGSLLPPGWDGAAEGGSHCWREQQQPLTQELSPGAPPK